MLMVIKMKYPQQNMDTCISGVMLLRLLLAALRSGHVDTASNQVKLLRPRVGRK